MATVTITPSAARDYQGATVLSTTNHWIGWVSGYAGAFTVRYTFRPTKKLKRITVRINGTKYGTADGNFRYAVSASSGLPGSWTSVTTEGSNYISITHTGDLNAGTTYYLFVSKRERGNYVYYSGCSAANVTITGETAGGGHVYRSGTWKDISPRKYRSGEWVELSPKKYDSTWKELS